MHGRDDVKVCGKKLMLWKADTSWSSLKWRPAPDAAAPGNRMKLMPNNKCIRFSVDGLC